MDSVQPSTEVTPPEQRCLGCHRTHPKESLQTFKTCSFCRMQHQQQYEPKAKTRDDSSSPDPEDSSVRTCTRCRRKKSEDKFGSCKVCNKCREIMNKYPCRVGKLKGPGRGDYILDPNTSRRCTCCRVIRKGEEFENHKTCIHCRKRKAKPPRSPPCEDNTVPKAICSNCKLERPEADFEGFKTCCKCRLRVQNVRNAKKKSKNSPTETEYSSQNEYVQVSVDSNLNVPYYMQQSDMTAQIDLSTASPSFTVEFGTKPFCFFSLPSIDRTGALKISSLGQVTVGHEITEMSLCEHIVRLNVPEAIKDIWIISQQIYTEAVKVYFEFSPVFIHATDVQTSCDTSLPQLRKYHVEATTKLEYFVSSEHGYLMAEMNFNKWEVASRDNENDGLEWTKDVEPLLKRAFFCTRIFE